MANQRPTDVPATPVDAARGGVGTGRVGLALVGGPLRRRADIDDEFADAQVSAGLVARLGGSAMADAAVAPQALAGIRLHAARQRPHHLQLLLTDADGQRLLPNDQALADAAPMRALLVRHRRLNQAGA